MAGPLDGPGVRDTILKYGKSATEGAVYFWGNLTKNIQDSTKGAVTVDSLPYQPNITSYSFRVGYIS